MEVQREIDRKILAGLRSAALDAEREAKAIAGKTNISAKVRKAQLTGANGAIGKIIVALFEKIKDFITEGQIKASRAAIQASLNWDRKLLELIEPNRARREALGQALLATADRNVQAMITRILQTKRPLSRQVWITERTAMRRLDAAINNALARGDSADQLAKKVKQFVNPSTPGGIAYAARRLARTEINNAFHAQSVNHNKDKPWVMSMEWHLSGSHRPRPGDPCQAMHGRQYPVEDVPAKPHPQCMCYITPTVMGWEQFKLLAENGTFQPWVDEHLQNKVT